MNRRESLKFLALATSAAAWPTLAIARDRNRIAIYDGRFPEGRAFGRGAARAYDCQVDAARLWFDRFAGRSGCNNTVVGLTGAADAMVLADCARREGLAFTRIEPAGKVGRLVAWTIARTDVL